MTFESIEHEPDDYGGAVPISSFWGDLARNMEKPRFSKTYVKTSLAIHAADSIVNGPRPTIHRIHRARLLRFCGVGVICPRRHRWLAACPCGWLAIFNRKWEADRGLHLFHLEEDHGGADD